MERDEEVSRDAMVGRGVKALREARGLSQAQVAQAMTDAGIENFYPQTVLKTEKGIRSLKLYEGIALAKILDVRAEELYPPDPASEHAAEIGRQLGRLVRAVSLVDRRIAEFNEAFAEFEDLREVAERLANDPDVGGRAKDVAERALEVLNHGAGSPVALEALSKLRHPSRSVGLPDGVDTEA